ncbi:PepSY-like domain-containing protein [Mucilaginibacter sp. AW1-3]
MKKLTKFNFLLLIGLISLTGLYSCQKSGFTNNPTADADATITAAAAIQVSSSANTTLTITTPSGVVTTPIVTSGIFVVNCYPPGAKKDSLTSFTSLPDTIGKYLTANYAGYTFQKAFKITTASGTANGYVVIITYNGKPVGLRFNASGVFVAVLEQREGHDLKGKGWHDGGCFGDRDGGHKDTLAVGALPAAIKSYFATSYPADTLLHAVVNFDATYIVISADNGLFATAFTSGGTFIKRVQIYLHAGRHASVAQSALPAAATAYLTATFPGYVFDKAFAETVNKVVKGYFVFINANNTRLVIQFDAGGNFVKTTVLR